jgi:hypothetical protein
MKESRNVQRCRWAEPTLFLASPYWTSAEEYPWSCHADGAPPHPVEDTTDCAVCNRWATRDRPDTGPAVVRR